jgi:hypothetical protein
MLVVVAAMVPLMWIRALRLQLLSLGRQAEQRRLQVAT